MKKLKLILLSTFLIAFAVLFLPGLTDLPVSAQTVFTEDYEGDHGSPGDWEWDRSGGYRFGYTYYKLVNKKTGATLPAGWRMTSSPA